MIRLSHVKFQSAVPVSSEVLRGAGRCLPLPQSVSLFPLTMRGSEKAKQRDTLGGFPMPSETPLLTKFLHPLEGLFSAKEHTEFYTLEPMDSFRNSERTTATAWARTISEVDLEAALFDEASFFKQLHGHMLRFPYVVFPHFAQILLQSRTSPSALSKLPGQIPPDWATLSPADAAFKLQVWISRGLAKQIGGKIQERPGYWSNNPNLRAVS
uniref:Uncharacterized protein n=1 Tax=Chromera velia CCMP2878 TaxID=1169474 RepID=A0A0G4GQ95_9ALVE|eukprot:Cvel_22895.t1-p1 / transcript=Cvel_22895.t1 / gene=Cvel_22895 / organism=Chromera_velia_CCMP2878 / gene_product=hypothetical protein / transcript_product=hypothetical protein / location=Cvel_scaffold2300:12946-13578(-) / protein_length=211 / sequence_SO=supercontig / SO=protein_coding / is_pseudo=false